MSKVPLIILKVLDRAIGLVVSAIFLAVLWNDWRRADPDGSIGDFAIYMAPGIGVGLVFLAGASVVAFSAMAINRWAAPPTDPAPPTTAGPVYALRHHPLHLGLCAGLIVAAVYAFWAWPGAAIILTGLSLFSCVLLARRMGLEPENDPAAPHNQSRT